MNLLCLPNGELKNIYDSKTLTTDENHFHFTKGFLIRKETLKY